MANDIVDPLERKYLVQDLLKEKDSDEDGGAKTRFEFDSDHSIDLDELEEHENAMHRGGRKAGCEEHGDDHEDNDSSGLKWTDVLSTHRNKGNTGPKGVKADYEEATRIQRRYNETKKIKEMEDFKRAAYGASMGQGESISLSSAKLKEKEKNGYDAEDDSDSDEEFLEKFRQKRLMQIQTAASSAQYGRVLQVDKFQFVSEVDNADPKSFVVVHLYEDYIIACNRMNDIIKVLASRHPHVKFIRLKATEADQTLSHSALPALLVYKNKKLVKDSTVNVVKTEFKHETTFSPEDLEFLLVKKYGIELPGVDISEREAQTSSLAANSSNNNNNQENTEASVVRAVGVRLGKTTLDDEDW